MAPSYLTMLVLVLLLGPVSLTAATATSAAASASGASIVVDGTSASVEFDGHGGLSAGGTSRLLIEYVPLRPFACLDAGALTRCLTVSLSHCLLPWCQRDALAWL